MLINDLIQDFYLKLSATARMVTRNYKFPIADELIKVAMGMRRTGKTYFLFQNIHALIKKGTPLQAILYINFEDDRLLPLDQKGLAALLESFYTLYPDNHNRCCYFFLDEIQNVTDWQLVIRRFFDSKNIQIYITGSSAKLLSKEIATSLRGRSTAIEIWPYSFSEFLLANQIEVIADPIGKATLDFMQKYFLDFQRIGGFPAVQNLEETTRIETLQTYVETVVFRDIVERHHVTNISLLKYLVHILLKNFSSPFSVNKFYNDIKSQGFIAGKDTIYNYLEYLEDAYLISTVSLFTESLRKSQVTPRKIYAIDCGLIQANIFSQTQNMGRLFENQIYLDLRRQKKKIFFYNTRSGYEIDFVTQSIDGKKEIIQVVWDMDDLATKRREQRALEEAQQELSIPGRIIDRNNYLSEFVVKSK